MAFSPTTYDVISRSHSNQFSPNLCQNVCKELSVQLTATEKAGFDEKKKSSKILRKTVWGLHSSLHPPPPHPSCTSES